MRFHDVQDARRPEITKKQRDEAFRRKYEWCMEKLSARNNDRPLVIAFGATFNI